MNCILNCYFKLYIRSTTLIKVKKLAAYWYNDKTRAVSYESPKASLILLHAPSGVQFCILYTTP